MCERASVYFFAEFIIKLIKFHIFNTWFVPHFYHRLEPNDLMEYHISECKSFPAVVCLFIISFQIKNDLKNPENTSGKCILFFSIQLQSQFLVENKYPEVFAGRCVDNIRLFLNCINSCLRFDQQGKKKKVSEFDKQQSVCHGAIIADSHHTPSMCTSLTPAKYLHIINL